MKAAFYFFIACCLYSCTENDMEQVKALVNEDELPLVVMDTARIEYTDSGKLKAMIIATRVENYIYFDEKSGKEDDQKLMMSNGVKAIFYDQRRNPNSTLTSEKATRYDKAKQTHIEDNVVVVNNKGDSLSTEYLLWDENTDKISSDKHVRVRTAEEIIFAEGFESDVNFEEYTFKKVRGTISLN